MDEDVRGIIVTKMKETIREMDQKVLEIETEIQERTVSTYLKNILYV